MKNGTASFPEIRNVIDLFEKINSLPRCSKNEKQLSDWLFSWARSNGFEAQQDKALNILVSVPASPGYESSPTVAIQGHMDMVCEKTPESSHDFTKDSIKSVYKDGWITADGTTLGADNGIALAIAMEIASNKDIKHPPLELLFTSDEETGLTGAMAVEAEWLESNYLLNLDSEDEGVFTVGCAGGESIEVSLPLNKEPVCSDTSFISITVGGLHGGHSGMDISGHRENAIILLARTLEKIGETTSFNIGSISGGSAHNAIPRDASAVISIPSGKIEMTLASIEKIENIFTNENRAFEPGFKISADKLPSNEKSEVIDKNSGEKLIKLILSLPNGVAGMSPEIEGLVETSNNLAVIRTENDSFKILSSQRSSVESRLDEISGKIRAVSQLAGAETERKGRYPSWQPDMNSSLVKRCREVYENMYGRTPDIEAIHAGLECGIIGSKHEGMEMISFGPTIKDPHTPVERMNLESLDKVFSFTKKLLSSFK
ncbi:MAG: aminoacyl-histidine dipeptidase [bacterium]